MTKHYFCRKLLLIQGLWVDSQVGSYAFVQAFCVLLSSFVFFSFSVRSADDNSEARGGDIAEKMSFNNTAREDATAEKTAQLEVSMQMRKKCVIEAETLLRGDKFVDFDRYSVELLVKCRNLATDGNFSAKQTLDAWLYALATKVPYQKRLKLNGRGDIARHFTAGIALGLVFGENTALSVAKGKELNDARPGGSGFDYNDLAASAFGIKFARFCRVLTENDAEILAEAFLQKLIFPSSFSPKTDLPILNNKNTPVNGDYRIIIRQIDGKWIKETEKICGTLGIAEGVFAGRKE